VTVGVWQDTTWEGQVFVSEKRGTSFFHVLRFHPGLGNGSFQYGILGLHCEFAYRAGQLFPLRRMDVRAGSMNKEGLCVLVIVILYSAFLFQRAPEIRTITQSAC
jgi:hypothetical protein